MVADSSAPEPADNIPNDLHDNRADPNGVHAPPPFHRDQPLPTRDLDDHFRGEDDPTNPHRAFPWSTVHYMSPTELEAHRVFAADGRLHWASDGSPVDTSLGATHWSGPGRAMYVMDEHGNLYVSLEQEVGRLHHSSFLGGRPVAGAGEIVVDGGKPMLLSRKSGHYRPTSDNLHAVRDELSNQGIDIPRVEDGF